MKSVFGFVHQVLQALYLILVLYVGVLYLNSLYHWFPQSVAWFTEISSGGQKYKSGMYLFGHDTLYRPTETFKAKVRWLGSNGCHQVPEISGGGIILVQQGGCPIAQKVYNLEQQGASAVVMVTDGEPAIQLLPRDNRIRIPTLSVSQAGWFSLKNKETATISSKSNSLELGQWFWGSVIAFILYRAAVYALKKLVAYSRIRSKKEDSEKQIPMASTEKQS